MEKVKSFARDNWVVLSLFLAALFVAAWFAFKFVATFLYLHDPRHKDGDLKGWMNPHFVMVLYDLPRPVVLDALQLPIEERGGRPLHDIAEELGLTMPELTEHIRNVAAEYRAGGS